MSKPGIGVCRQTKSRDNRLTLLMVMLIVSLALQACNLPLVTAEQISPAPTENPFLTTPRPTLGQATAIAVTAPPRTDIPPTHTPTKSPPVMYTVQSGDTLAALTSRFGIQPGEIISPDPLGKQGLLKPGQLLIIPRDLGETSPPTKVLPDSEVVYSPTALGFDIKAFVRDAKGYLNTYKEYIGSGMKTGAEIVQQVATDNSINPRLLLALLEFQAHWVTGQPGNLAESEYPLGNYDANTRGLYKQLNWAVEQLMDGYYSWRAGELTEVIFPNQGRLRLAPEANAGTVALQVFFSKKYNAREWAGVLYSSQGFGVLYERLFGSPWTRAGTIEPLFPYETTQPQLDLPFYYDITWSLTGGPHGAWSASKALAALDFAPGSDVSGCVPSQQWVLAPAAGRVARSENGLLVLDLDGDGREQTGWVIVILHLQSDKIRPVDSLVAKDEPLGHPSCEAGFSTGTHIHLARKYNGEWILADGALPFTLGGWVAHNGKKDYEGYLTKGSEVVTACTCGSMETRITRTRP